MKKWIERLAEILICDCQGESMQISGSRAEFLLWEKHKSLLKMYFFWKKLEDTLK